MHLVTSPLLVRNLNWVGNCIGGSLAAGGFEACTLLDNSGARVCIRF